MSEVEPEQIEVRAINIVPYEHALWCTVGDSKPFANTIARRSWSEDGESIWFMLDTHNFAKYKPTEMVRVVQKTRNQYAPARRQNDQYDNAMFLEGRPRPKRKCEHCSGTGETQLVPSTEGEE